MTKLHNPDNNKLLGGPASLFEDYGSEKEIIFVRHGDVHVAIGDVDIQLRSQDQSIAMELYCRLAYRHRLVLVLLQLRSRSRLKGEEMES